MILTSHPAIVIPPECGFIVWLLDKYGNWGDPDSQETDRRSDFLNDLSRAKKIDTWNLDLVELERKILTNNPNNYAELCDLVYRCYGEKFQKRDAILGDKNNFHVKHLENLRRIYPDARFVHLVRDGRDVACSYREVMTMRFMSPYAPKLETRIDKIAQEWLENTRRVLMFSKQIGKSRTITVRYEDLVSDSARVVDKLCNWLGVEHEDKMLSFYKKNRSSLLEPKATLEWKKRTLEPISNVTVGRYKSVLTQAEIESFHKVASEGLKAFGYISD